MTYTSDVEVVGMELSALDGMTCGDASKRPGMGLFNIPNYDNQCIVDFDIFRYDRLQSSFSFPS